MLNLVQNAIEAAETGDQRLVRVSARSIEDGTWRSISPSGKVLLFEVENSGPPIPDDVRARLFRPFFTTKTQGLGLGLSTSAKIVRQHHGIVDVQTSEHPPYSTIFTVGLPA